MKVKYIKFLAILMGAVMAAACGKAGAHDAQQAGNADSGDSIIVGAAQIGEYLPALEGKRVALYSNHTGIVEPGKHTLDLLLDNGVDVRCVFSPEHGFRGDADAGEQVSSSVDPKTGINIVSLYGRGHKQAMENALDSIDLIITDIQDVGLRYYTYYCTMLELMDAAAQRQQQFVVLDRPNPNGMYVDGPILDMKLQSGVGRLPIPIVHGLTLGEMALMANAEKWLPSGQTVELQVVPCQGYTHQSRYQLPVPPSPNLPNMTSIYLYPSLCYFEGTPVSLGRGTDKPFQIYGHPKMKNRTFEFTPEGRPGAQNPPQKGQLCHGVDLSGLDHEEIIANGINLEYLVDAYRDVQGDDFFTKFFELLIGRDDIRQMIIDGKSADEIKATWAGDVEAFKQQRKPYLLYAE